ncbi:MAG: Aminotransferase, class V superfamily, partial [uncultured bacterium]
IFHSILSSKSKTIKRIVISSIEHKALINTAKYFENLGFKVDYIPVNEEGVIDIKYLEKYLEKFSKKTALVSIMAVNNETGVIQPFMEIAEICKHYKVPYMSDTCQLIGKSDFKFNESKLDYAIISGHKIGAMSGTGIMLIKNPHEFQSMFEGAGQENGIRGGTQNYIGIETMAVAFEVFSQELSKLSELEKQREEFENKLKKRFPEIYIAGLEVKRLPNTTFIAYPGLMGQAIQIELEALGIYVSTASACGDNEPIPSHVLKAMGVNDKVSRGAIRISTSVKTSKTDNDNIYESLSKIYEKFQKIGSF